MGFTGNQKYHRNVQRPDEKQKRFSKIETPQ
jgi:hypothetical protein